jgi:hypothetical protein
MPGHANDNVEGRTGGTRTIEPFHRLWTSELLHKNAVTNAGLYYVGENYRKHYRDAGGTGLSEPPAYVKPVRYDKYDLIRNVQPVLVDKCLPYRNAAKVLDALEIREVVEAIVVHGRPIVGVGKQYSGYKTKNQAQSAAITALRIGLIALRNHYDAAKMEMAA